MFRNSIRTRLMALVLLATVIPAGVSVTFSYIYTKQSVTEQSVKQNTKLLTLGEANLSSYFGGINQRAMTLYSGINVQGSFYTALLVAKAPDTLPAGETVPDNRGIVSTQLYNLFLSDQNIFQVHLYIRAVKQSNTVLGGLFRRETNDTYMPTPNPGGGNRPFIEVTHKDHQYGLRSGFLGRKVGTVPVFSAHFPIYRTPSDEVLADLSMDFRLTELESISRSMYNSETERLYILNEQGEALYASEPNWIGRTFKEGWTQGAVNQESGHFTWNDRGFKGIVMYRHLNSSLFKGTIIKLVPYEDLYSDARTITRINGAIGVIFLIIGGIAAVLISIGFTRPIKKLISYTQKVQIGQLDAVVDAEREDEFGLLTRKISGMTRTINNLILQEYRLEIANKTNQLKALQAQINPHFLYNALQSIGTSSLRYNAPKVYELIYSLGSMMRYSMGTERTQVTLREEIEHVENYMLLQQERFGEEELRLDISITEAASEIIVPKMILQPIVENVFKHGFTDGIRQGVIMIRCWLERGALQITVKDNGTGVSEEDLDHLETALRSTDGTEHEEIGLRNVRARLRLQISEQADLTIGNNPEGGVTVTLTIPLTDERYDEGSGQG
ncbi:sensor histidine kinase [Paenibacillus sp. sgz500958]|uniref:sensor histidine kinase n=1 Tax=Paenibacillus sp. sgz500958 TaxID=3242475 RepID=UPI0036D22452